MTKYRKSRILVKRLLTMLSRIELLSPLILTIIVIPSFAQAQSPDDSLDFTKRNASWRIVTPGSEPITPLKQDQKSPKSTVGKVKEQIWNPLDVSELPLTFGDRIYNLPAYICMYSNKTCEFELRSSPITEKTDDPKGIELEQKAFELIKDSKYNDARPILQAALRLNPGRGSTWYNFGILCEKSYDWLEARKAFAASTKLEPSFEVAWLELARCTCILGNESKAVQILSEHKLKPSSGNKKIDGVYVMCADPANCNAEVFANCAENELMVGALTAVVRQNKQVLQAITSELANRKISGANAASLKGFVAFLDGQNEVAKKSFLLSAQISANNPIANFGLRITQRGTLDLPLSPSPINIPLAVTPRKTNEEIDRRNFGKMPINVYIPDLDLVFSKWKEPPDRSIDFVNLVEYACSAWERASSRKISFKIHRVKSTDPPKPTASQPIVIRWVNSSDAVIGSHSNRLGVTECLYSFNSLVLCKVNLLLPTTRGAETSHHFYETALHELGHALGLVHSANPQDIMYYSIHTDMSRSLTIDDERRIRKLYDTNRYY